MKLPKLSGRVGCICATAILLFPAICGAQYAKSDTVQKLIFGIGNSNFITFRDPEFRPNHVELTVDDPSGLSIDHPVVDSAWFKTFDVTSLRYGTFVVRAKYRCQTPGSEADSGTEYVRVRVVKEPRSRHRHAPGTEGFDLSAATVVICRLHYFDKGVKKEYEDARVFYFTPNVLFIRWAGVNYATALWTPPKGRTITSICASEGEEGVINIILDDGSVYRSDFVERLQIFGEPGRIGKVPTSPEDAEEFFFELKGDALYARSNKAIYVTRDFGKSWQIDTAGLNGASNVTQLAVDSSQNVYAAENGLYKQSPAANSWTLLTNLPNSYLSALFIDRRNRIFAAFYDHTLRVSTDQGATWTLDSAGIGTSFVTSFGDDAFGNVYAVTGTYPPPNKLYKLTGGAGTWSRIGQQINALSADSNVGGVFHVATGDSVLYAGTLFGLFVSSDQGQTWTESNGGLETPNIYSYLKTSNDLSFLSTNRGIYSGHLDDSDWTKKYPADGYENGLPLFVDNSGALYTLGTPRIVNYNSQSPTLKSTDNGVSWVPDTLGLGTFATTFFNVSQDGRQHIATIGNSVDPPHIYAKSPGLAWAPDSEGFAGERNERIGVFGSDKQGNLFLTMTDSSNRFLIWDRKSSTGRWQLDTAGMNGGNVSVFAAGKTSGMYAAGVSGVFRFDGVSWSRLPMPAGWRDSTYCVALSVDSSGALWAGIAKFLTQVSGYNVGAFFTTDDGATWTLAGLDSLPVTSLVSFGDTTYALAGDGIYSMTRQAESAVATTLTQRREDALHLSVFPSPPAEVQSIRFFVPKEGHTRLLLYDIRGEIVRSIFDGIAEFGEHVETLDSRKLPAGCYIVVLESGKERSSHQMVIAR